MKIGTSVAELSKREYFAGIILAGICSSGKTEEHCTLSTMAVKQADELIAELNRTVKTHADTTSVIENNTALIKAGIQGHLGFHEHGEVDCRKYDSAKPITDKKLLYHIMGELSKEIASAIEQLKSAL